MMKKTHLNFSILLILLLQITNIQFILITLISTMIPDIDIKKHIIKKLLIISVLIIIIINYSYYLLFITIIYILLSHMLGHRKITHSLLGLLLFMLPFNKYIYPITLGYCSHLFMDMNTKSGVNLLYPLKYKFKLLNITTNSLKEHILNFIILIINIIFFIINFKYLLT